LLSAISRQLLDFGIDFLSDSWQLKKA